MIPGSCQKCGNLPTKNHVGRVKIETDFVQIITETNIFELYDNQNKNGKAKLSELNCCRSEFYQIEKIKKIKLKI